jgi:hypothetical protein
MRLVHHEAPLPLREMLDHVRGVDFLDAATFQRPPVRQVPHFRARKVDRIDVQPALADVATASNVQLHQLKSAPLS